MVSWQWSLAHNLLYLKPEHKKEQIHPAPSILPPTAWLGSSLPKLARRAGCREPAPLDSACLSDRNLSCGSQEGPPARIWKIRRARHSETRPCHFPSPLIREAHPFLPATASSWLGQRCCILLDLFFFPLGLHYSKPKCPSSTGEVYKHALVVSRLHCSSHGLEICDSF